MEKAKLKPIATDSILGLSRHDKLICIVVGVWFVGAVGIILLMNLGDRTTTHTAYFIPLGKTQKYAEPNQRIELTTEQLNNMPNIAAVTNVCPDGATWFRSDVVERCLP